METSWVDRGCAPAARRRSATARRGLAVGRLLWLLGALAAATSTSLALSGRHALGPVTLGLVLAASVVLAVRGAIQIDESTPLEGPMPHQWIAIDEGQGDQICRSCGAKQRSTSHDNESTHISDRTFV